MNGVLNLLKPPGMTSSDCVALSRRLLGEKKVGHTGTLDPDACGVLPLGVGKGTRLFDVLLEKKKRYLAELTLGVETDTQDQCGRIVRRQSLCFEREAVEAVLPRFRGGIMQRPPMYSAVRVEGKRLYEYARKNQIAEVAERPAEVYELELGEQTGPASVLLSICCGRGTYVRTLCHDIGRALGCGAHMSFLLRSASGPFHLGNAHTLEELEAASARGEAAGLLVPIDMPLLDLPRADAQPGCRKALRSGNPLPLSAWTGEEKERIINGELARLYCEGEFYGTARQEQGLLKLQMMLWEGEGA